jgi:hypothetical protein
MLSYFAFTAPTIKDFWYSLGRLGLAAERERKYSFFLSEIERTSSPWARHTVPESFMELSPS